MAATASAGGQPEDAGDPDPARQRRSDDQRDGEGEGDADADRRHALGAHLVAGQIRGQGDGDGGDRPATLDRAADDDPMDTVRQRGHQTAEQEEGQTAVDHRLASDAVGQQPKRDLEDRLGQAIGADRQTHQQGRRAGQVLGVEREHRQHHEEPEHAGRKDGGKAGGGAALGSR